MGTVGKMDGLKDGSTSTVSTAFLQSLLVAPVPKPGKDTYKDGYNRGFVAGVDEAKRRKRP